LLKPKTTKPKLIFTENKDTMHLLLISNSTMAGQPFLDYPKDEIKRFLGEKPVNIIFIPYAAVTFSFDDYEKKVNERFAEIGHSVTSIHHFSKPVKAIEEADVIIIGGGNTWQLVNHLHKKKLLPAIRNKVLAGIPYIGWSAGANVACPTLRTTNDMPIVDPIGFDTLNLIPFQINPHYLDSNPENHAGETREQRIEEFIKINPKVYVVGLREGSILKIEHGIMNLIGDKTIRIFRKGIQPKELSANDDLSFLLER
jgi:dipeptidase E